jgi:thiamine biosynthesis lipoprotein
METFAFRAMNTDILLAALGSPERTAQGFEEARRFIQASESRFTRFSEDSELSALNRSAGTPFQASPDLYAVVALAQHFYHQTRGLFDPSVLTDLKRIGYDRSMDLVRNLGSIPLFESLLAGERPSFSEMDLDEVRGMILLPQGMSLDLGGIAKGWIAEQAAMILSEFSSACAVNAGGDMFLVGLPEGETYWPVAIEDPLQPEIDLTTINVDPGAVATSSVTKRVWKQGDTQRHHLIDPRTGEPAQTDWLSVTVIAPHAYEAEVFAKALLIGGPRESEEIALHGGTRFSYLAVDHEKKLWGNQNYLENLYVNRSL